MALSGFIKQLLETDSVFGSEAKKFTGINDRSNVFRQFSDDSYKPGSQGVEIQIDFRGNVNTGFINVDIGLPQFGPDFNTLFPVPEFMRAGAYFKLNLSNFASAEDRNLVRDPVIERELAEELTGSVFLIEEVVTFKFPSTNPNLRLTCSITEADGPKLLAIADRFLFNNPQVVFGLFGPVDVELDFRIGSVIQDKEIADIDSSGATRFNLDNTGVGGSIDRGSGIASKYASHYHGDQLINLVTNTRDEANNPLFRLQLNEAALSSSTFTARYNETAAFNFVDDRNLGTTELIRVEYSDGTGPAEVVATFGDIGTTGEGFINLNGLPTPWTSDTNRGTRMIINDFTYEFGLPVSEATHDLRIWPAPGPSAPQFQVHEHLRTLRDAIRLDVLGTIWQFDIISGETDTVQVMRVSAAKNDAYNITLPHERATLALFDVIFTVPVTGATTPQAVSGNQFITYDDLITVLTANRTFNIEIGFGDTLDSIVFSTVVSPEKLITLISPSDASNIFIDADGNLVSRGNVGSDALNQVVNPAELVLDRFGNAVFSRDTPQ